MSPQVLNLMRPLKRALYLATAELLFLIICAYLLDVANAAYEGTPGSIYSNKQSFLELN